MSPPGGDLGQRLEDETATVQPSVGKGQSRRRDPFVPDVQEIDVDRAGAVSERRPPATPPLDALDGRQEILGRERSSDFDDGVEEVPLARMPSGAVS